jgi:hypothetical protein
VFLETDSAVLSLDFTNEFARAWCEGGTQQSLDVGNENRGQAFSGFAPTYEFDVPPGGGLYSCEGPARMLIDRCLGRPGVDRAPGILGVHAVAIMEAAVESARQGAAVTVELGR